jgi:uncharacterized protein YjbI with pentapeptide repeats
MVDKSQLAILKSGVEAWSAWRVAHADMRPELSGAQLYGLDLIGADLAGANLRNADLRGTNLSDAKLTNADLEAANFFKAVLDRADLAGANLVGAKFLEGSQLMAAQNWRLAARDANLACGAPIPQSRGRS